MICPECKGRGTSIYFVEVDRDENSVTVEKREGICRTCNGTGEQPMTNADRVRAMSDEELAEWSNFCPHIDEECKLQGCTKCILEWLKQPVEDE